MAAMECIELPSPAVLLAAMDWAQQLAVFGAIPCETWFE
jgi:hypothetical protein